MIAVVGGSGDFGQGLAERLRRLGEDVVVGSRTPRGDFVANDEAARAAEIVFLSIPPGSVEGMAGELADALAGRIVVSVAANVLFRDGKPGAAATPISLAETTALEAPGARVVAGFHTVSAKALADADAPLDEDVLICGDDAEAKRVVGDLAAGLVTGRAVDCGGLEVARWLETLTVVLLNVNRRYKTNAGIRVTGLP